MKNLANRRTGTRLRSLYRILFRAFGQQHWWPAKTPFEVMVGAILTQNTAWANVTKAIGNLRRRRLLTPARLRKAPTKQLAALIRPSGYFNQKAKRLKIFVEQLDRLWGGSLSRMKRIPLKQLRPALLRVSGIGPETADSILLYAFDKPSFVVDAYTRRVLTRHGLISLKDSYDQIQDLFMRNLPRNALFFNEYHALFVELGKEYCHRLRPRCRSCPLGSFSRIRLEPGIQPA